MLAAACGGQLVIPMPRKRKLFVRNVQATHLKFVGVTAATHKLYNSAISEFMMWRRRNSLPRCSTFEEVDLQLAEYINSLYVKGDPMYKAANALSGLRRAIPQARRRLEVSGQYYKNWVRVTVRTRAIPLKSEWVRAFATHAFLKGEPDLAILLLTGFLGLLRVSELTSLTYAQILPCTPGGFYLCFPNSKGAQLKGSPEQVRIKNVAVSAVLLKRLANARPFDRVFSYSYTDVLAFVREAAEYFGLPSKGVTTHCLRRGGATWHFGLYSNYNLTADHGRWAQIRSCRAYVNQAMIDLAASAQSQDGAIRSAEAAKALPAVPGRIV